MVQTIEPAALRWWARTILHKQLAEAEIERFPVEAERLHKSSSSRSYRLAATIAGRSSAPRSAIEDGRGHHRQGCALHSMVWDRTGLLRRG